VGTGGSGRCRQAAAWARSILGGTAARAVRLRRAAVGYAPVPRGGQGRRPSPLRSRALAARPL